MEEIEFTRNYNDHSTPQGFQFEFNCNRCGNGYRSTFQPWAVGTVAGALNAASSLFGGVFGQAANLGESVRSAQWQQACDSAFIDAAQKIKPSFVQCPRCTAWVCRKSCWNQARGLCKSCAPDLAVEISAQQSAKALESLAITARLANKAGLAVNAGHDLTVANLPQLCKAIPDLKEVSIGHGLTCDALEFGMAGTVERHLKALGVTG